MSHINDNPLDDSSSSDDQTKTPTNPSGIISPELFLQNVQKNLIVPINKITQNKFLPKQKKIFKSSKLLMTLTSINTSPV